ncbi:hypothetical protein CQ006_18480 [Pseudomonas cedrina]|uniref:Uncharacterized protein n=1 Tax=Pseudomonas cedrina TaxID=651740 RepID=A0A2S9DLK1_PSECE|nr:hypothetical protein CQ006_18480 [Pseudomonas cedrina]
MQESSFCGEGACSRSTAQLESAFLGGASHPSASRLARHGSFTCFHFAQCRLFSDQKTPESGACCCPASA